MQNQGQCTPISLQDHSLFTINTVSADSYQTKKQKHSQVLPLNFLVFKSILHYFWNGKENL